MIPSTPRHHRIGPSHWIRGEVRTRLASYAPMMLAGSQGCALPRPHLGGRGGVRRAGRLCAGTEVLGEAREGRVRVRVRVKAEALEGACEGEGKGRGSSSGRGGRGRRDAVLRGAGGAAVAVVAAGWAGPAARASDRFRPAQDNFVRLESGLLVLDLKEGSGAAARVGDTVSVDWSGFTSGYQGKRFENTTGGGEKGGMSGDADAAAGPFRFKVGDPAVVRAFSDAVVGMSPGGVRRVEIPGEEPDLGWPRDKARRAAVLPVPHDFDGKRSLDFVLDNPTLMDFNRTLVLNLRLNRVN